MISSSQVKLGKSDLASRELGFVILKDNCRFSNSRVSFGQNLRLKKAGFTLRAVHAEPVKEVMKKPSGSVTKSKPVRFAFSFLFFS